MNTEWNVPMQIRRAGSPSMAMIRERISSAAFFVKVSARILSGGTPRDISSAIRAVSTLVLPLPAPATMSIGPSVEVTASRWAGLNRSMACDMFWTVSDIVQR